MTAFKSSNCCSCEPGRKVNIAREIIKDSYYNGKFDYLNFHYADDENKWIKTVSLLFCDAIFLSFGNINYVHAVWIIGASTTGNKKHDTKQSYNNLFD